MPKWKTKTYAKNENKKLKLKWNNTKWNTKWKTKTKMKMKKRMRKQTRIKLNTMMNRNLNWHFWHFLQKKLLNAKKSWLAVKKFSIVNIQVFSTTKSNQIKSNILNNWFWIQKKKWRSFGVKNVNVICFREQPKYVGVSLYLSLQLSDFPKGQKKKSQFREKQ